MLFLDCVNKHCFFFILFFFFLIFKEIEGTLELQELYTTVSDIDLENEPRPVEDENPSKNDLKFMTKAYEVSKKSLDESTKVSPS